MAFDSKNFELVAQATNGKHNVFKYWSNDLLTAIDDSAYFNDVADQLAIGDTIKVSGDVDGTPAINEFVVTAVSPNVTVSGYSTVTQTFAERAVVSLTMPAIGTAETMYIVAPFDCTVTYVAGVSRGNGPGSGGTSTITVTVPTTGAIATLAFVEGYTAGTAVVDATITAHVTVSQGAVITVATDGTGTHTEPAEITLELTPA